MKHFVRAWALPWVGFCLILSCVAASSQDWVRILLGLDLWTATASEFAAKVGIADMGSYVHYAKVLVERPGWVMNSPYVRNWPPGFPVVIAVILKLTGEDAYLAKMLIVTVLFWSTALTIALNLVPFHRNRWVRFACLSLLWVLPLFRKWTFGMGYLYSESSSMALLLVALALVTRGLIREARGSFYVAAVILAVAANFRLLFDATFAPAIAVLCVGILVWLCLAATTKVLRESGALSWRSLREKIRSPALGPIRGALRVVAICLLILIVGTMPWKLYNYSRYGVYAFSTGTHVWPLQWGPPEKLAEFAHAANTACLLDIRFCRLIYANRFQLQPSKYKYLTIAAFLEHPLDWFALRLSKLSYLWVDLPWKPFPGAKPQEYAYYAEGSLYGLSLMVGLWLLASSRRASRAPRDREVWMLFGAIVLVYLGTNAALFTVVHYEERYSLPVRFFCLWVPAGVLSIRNARAVRGKSAEPAPEATVSGVTGSCARAR